MTCERDSRRDLGNLHPGAKAKKRKKYTRVQIVYFYRLLQADVISKRENSLGYIGRQVNSLTGLSIVMFFRLIQVKSIVEDGLQVTGTDIKSRTSSISGQMDRFTLGLLALECLNIFKQMLWTQ